MKTNRLRIILMAILALCVCSCGNKKEEKAGNMKYRSLGNTGIEVSEIGIGCGVFEYLDTAQSRQYMDIAIDSGINYMDIYDANPEVRDRIGYALQGRRDKMNIQAAIGNVWNAELNQNEGTRDVEKAKIGFEDLLSRLGTDHIEVGMMHIVDNMAEWDSLLGSPYIDYMKQLKSEGKIKHIGVSSHNASVALAAAKSGLVEVIMFSLNPAFDRLSPEVSPWEAKESNLSQMGIDPTHQQLYDYCAQNNIAIVVMKALGGGGRLLDAEKSPLGVALTPTQCLAYALAKPCVSVALCGSRCIDHLVDDLHYLVATDEEKDFESALTANTQNSDHGNCTYCGHCTPCPAGINIAKVNQLLDKAQQSEEVPADVMAEYKALEHHAGECVGCGACENRCPFDVPIREKMQQAVRTFGF